MSVEGVWKVEMLGPYGWDQIATAFLLNGRYLAASADHYSIGSYKEAAETLNVKARTTQHGKIRTLFGGKEEHLDPNMEARIEDADQIVGEAKHPGGGNFETAEQPQKGGLAAPRRPDDAGKAAGGHRQCHPVERLGAVIEHAAQPDGLEQGGRRVGHWRGRAGFRKRSE